MYLTSYCAPFINKAESSGALSEIINDVVPELWLFFEIATYVADAATVNSNSDETFLGSNVSSFFISG